jgi:hypothetical protein
MEFEVIDLLRGVELKDTVIIWDNPAPVNSCVGDYEKDTRYLGDAGDSVLLIIAKIDTVDSWGAIGDYYRPLGVCSSPYLPIKNKQIVGNLTETDVYATPPTTFLMDTISISYFNQLYQANGREVDCDLFVGLPNNPPSESMFQVVPNPVEQSFTINTTFKSAEARIYTLRGQLMRKVDKPVGEINIQELPAGIYLLEVELQGGEKMDTKLIKK